MTNERMAIEALDRCTFTPGCWNKRFAHNIAALPENTLLSVKQRQCLWKLVHRYRRQMPPACLEFLKIRQAWEPMKLVFEDELDSKPDDAVQHSVYADWLEENGEIPLANAQRWMVERGIFPHLIPDNVGFSKEGVMSYAHFQWSLDMAGFLAFEAKNDDENSTLGRISTFPWWFRSRQDLEEMLSLKLSASPDSPMISGFYPQIDIVTNMGK